MCIRDRYEGKASFAMIGLVTGGVLNIVLDPLFIFVFKMGTGGAGLATALSQCCLLYTSSPSGELARGV